MGSDVGDCCGDFVDVALEGGEAECAAGGGELDVHYGPLLGWVAGEEGGEVGGVAREEEVVEHAAYEEEGVWWWGLWLSLWCWVCGWGLGGAGGEFVEEEVACW